MLASALNYIHEKVFATEEAAPLDLSVDPYARSVASPMVQHAEHVPRTSEPPPGDDEGERRAKTTKRSDVNVEEDEGVAESSSASKQPRGRPKANGNGDAHRAASSSSTKKTGRFSAPFIAIPTSRNLARMEAAAAAEKDRTPHSAESAKPATTVRTTKVVVTTTTTDAPTATPPIKRKVGRPRKSDVASSQIAIVSAKEPEASTGSASYNERLDADDASSVPKRGRGRPPKKNDSGTSKGSEKKKKTSTAKEVLNGVVSKKKKTATGKKRGRPPKTDEEREARARSKDDNIPILPTSRQQALANRRAGVPDEPLDFFSSHTTASKEPRAPVTKKTPVPPPHNDAVPSASHDDEQPPLKRKRGRPSKAEAAAREQAQALDDVIDDIPLAQAYPDGELAAEAEAAHQAVKKGKRGRPRKHPVQTTEKREEPPDFMETTQ